MKSISCFFVAIALLFFSNINAFAQTSIPTGKAQLIEFSNTNSSFTVPQGKSWVVYSIFSDYVTGGVVKYDEYTKQNYLDKTDDIRIFIKNLNGQEKTNIGKNLYGTQVFRSSNASTIIQFPLIFPENTNISFLVVQGDLGRLKEYNGKAYISLVEVDN